MHIGIEASAFYKNIAGSGVYARNLIHTLNQMYGADNTISFYSSRRESEIDLEKKRGVLARWITGIKDLFWTQIVLPLRLKRDRVDVLFGPSFFGPVFSPCPLVVTILDLGFIRFPHTVDLLLRIYLRFIIPLVKRKADVIVTISDFSKSEIVELLKVPEDKIQVIYPARADSFGVKRDEDKLKRVKNQYKLPDVFILNVGTLEPRKNIVTLIKAFGNLKNNDLIEHSLVLCGPKGWYYQEIFHAITEWGLEKDVHYIGYIPESDLPYMYNLAQVFVYPSAYEGFGLPVLEAMACGCPVITSNTASLPEVVGGAAILVDPENCQELEQSLLRLVKDELLRSKLGAQGVERAKVFSSRRSAEKLFDVLCKASQGLSRSNRFRA